MAESICAICSQSIVIHLFAKSDKSPYLNLDSSQPMGFVVRLWYGDGGVAGQLIGVGPWVGVGVGHGGRQARGKQESECLKGERKMCRFKCTWIFKRLFFTHQSFHCGNCLHVSDLASSEVFRFYTDT